MKRGIIVMAALVTVWAAGSAHGFYLDDERTLEVTGKVFTQGSLRMEDSDSGGRYCAETAGPGTVCTGFTFPDTKRGQLIQHRNLIDVEMYHDVARWIGPQFHLLDKLGYRLRVKYFYDGLYDYGPVQYRTPAKVSNIFDQQGVIEARHLDTQKNPLWNAYIEMAKGPLFLRVGRQDLSWGESDGFRLLDMIEPLDNRFGFPLVEDLDDRRIPLWMVRPTYNLGTIGPLSNLTLEGYWVPGTVDNAISPAAPSGNPFGLANPPGAAVIHRPNKNIGNSRGGGRIIGTVGNLVTMSIAHYVTFNDIPSAQLYVNDLADPRGVGFLVDYYQQQITGASATFALPFDPYTIVRMEAANFWDERVFIPEQSANAGKLVNDFLATGQPQLGELATKNTLRWMIGLDRNVWLRWLNPSNTFLLSGQYFHTNIVNYQRDLANAVVSSETITPFGPAFHYVPRKNDEVTITYLINTLYMHGTLTPQVFGAYDTRGVWSIVPSISYQIGSNWVVTAKYSIITGPYANLGFFRDRDMALLRVQYNLS